MHVTFPCTKNAPIPVCVYSSSACSVLRVCMTWKRAVYAYCKNLCIRQHAASVGFVHARMNVSAGLSDANATLSLLARLFLCCVRRKNISSRSCHSALWAALRSQGRQQSMLPGGGTFCEKPQIYYCQGEYGSIISVFTSIKVLTSIYEY